MLAAIQALQNKEKAYIATYTGKQFFLLKPRLEDIDIIDIAHALSLQCRWTGHTRFHYSIAQHSVYCSLIGPEEEAFERLMHDGEEAYIGDMNRPLKHYTEAGVVYCRQGEVLKRAMCERFGLSVIEPASVHLADNAMLYAEKEQLLSVAFDEAENWERYHDYPMPVITRWSPEQAETMFLRQFNDLYRRRVN
jgi:5'-deoxynucleotidase YfbR-like HD superfamily hydrolase